MAQGRHDPLGTARAAGGLVSDALLDRLARARARAEPDAAGSEPEAGRPEAPPAAAPPAPAAPERARPSFVEARVDAAADLVGGAVARAMPAILDRLDVNALLDRVDVQRVVDRVDVDDLAERIDVERVLAGVDVDALVDRIDVERLTSRIDVGEVAAEALEAVDVGDLIRESTASLGTEAVEVFRLQAIVADGMLARAVDAVLRRRGPRGGG